MQPLAHELFDDMAPFADMLDTAYGGTRYADTMAALRQRIDHPDLCPSAQVLEAARAHKGFFKYAMAVSRQHRETLLAQPLQGETLERFEISARDSLALQRRIEENEQGSFEDYVAGYYA